MEGMAAPAVGAALSILKSLYEWSAAGVIALPRTKRKTKGRLHLLKGWRGGMNITAQSVA